MHESLHAISEQTFFTETNDDGSMNISESRVGLRLRSSWKEDFSRFRGLNEFIVCTLVYYSMEKLVGVLEKRFGITSNDLKNKPIHGSGSEHSDFFDKVMNIINNNKSVDGRDFIMNIIRSHFSGHLNVLKDIDLVFGSGSIRVLSYLDAFIDKDVRNQVNGLVEEFFLKANINRKGEIIEKLKEIEEKMDID